MTTTMATTTTTNNNNNSIDGLKKIYLYLCKPPPNVLINTAVVTAATVNDVDNDPVIYFENIKECLTDDRCDKYAYFAELKQQQALFMQKICNHLICKNNGNFVKDHVLFDALIMYTTYATLIDESAFGINVLNSCEQFIAHLFRIFVLSGVVIVTIVPTNWENDNLSVLLKHLYSLGLIKIEIV
jgi:hypothetical protein